MDSNPSLEEPSFVVNELLYDDSYEENNNLNFDESQPSIHHDELFDLSLNASLNYVSQMLLEEIDENTIFDQEEAALRATEKSFYDILGQEYPSPADEITQNKRDLNNNNNNNNGDYDSNYKQSMESLLDLQFQIGVQQARKFLPSVDKLSINSDQCSNFRSKMNKNSRNFDLAGASDCKKIAFYSEEPLRNETFDKVLLAHKKEHIGEVLNLREIMQKETKNKLEQNSEKSMMDLTPLLINCSHAISNNDHNISNELIKKIRENSSPIGNWCQRLAHYFLDGLEARLAGTGSEIYHKLVSEQPTTMNCLKAFQIYLAACPYIKAAYFFSNRTILNISKNSSKIHIIDFGIKYGFQWPSFLQRISTWRNPIPKIMLEIF